MKKYPYSKLLRLEKPMWKFLQKQEDSTAYLRLLIEREMEASK